MESTDAKKECGAFVVMRNGKRYLFNETATWTWDMTLGVPKLTVIEDGKPAFEAFSDNIQCVGGHNYFFKDAWWGKE